jgi:hypothetical protein
MLLRSNGMPTSQETRLVKAIFEKCSAWCIHDSICSISYSPVVGKMKSQNLAGRCMSIRGRRRSPAHLNKTPSANAIYFQLDGITTQYVQYLVLWESNGKPIDGRAKHEYERQKTVHVYVEYHVAKKQERQTRHCGKCAHVDKKGNWQGVRGIWQSEHGVYPIKVIHFRSVVGKQYQEMSLCLNRVKSVVSGRHCSQQPATILTVLWNLVVVFVLVVSHLQSVLLELHLPFRGFALLASIETRLILPLRFHHGRCGLLLTYRGHLNFKWSIGIITKMTKQIHCDKLTQSLTTTLARNDWMQNNSKQRWHPFKASFSLSLLLSLSQ